MSEEFNVGDIVYLKSGSPKMVIRELLCNDFIDVTWITDGGSSVKQHSFIKACLTKTEPKRIA